MAISKLVPRLVPKLALWAAPLVVLFGASALWHGGGQRPTTEKEFSAAEARAAAETRAAEARSTIDALGVETTVLDSTLLVDFRDDVSAETLANNGFVEIPVSDYSARDRLYRMQFGSAAEAAAARVKLAGDPDVESVDYDAQMTLPPEEEMAAAGAASLEAECQSAATPGAAFPNDACFKYQWHLRQIGMEEAWKRGTGKGVVVAVIDTGVSKVADLTDTKFTDGYNFISNSANAADDHGHGTHVAGTIAQSTNNKIGVAGVAYGATIMPLKVLSARGSGSVGGIAQAIRWAADHGANVINMSLGGPTPIGTMGSAVKYAHDKGVVVVAAAGNDGRGKVGYPAAYPGVIAVASTQFDEKTTFYSNWGKQIDVAAPGGNTRVDQNGDGKPDGVLQHTIVPGDTSRTDYLWFMGTSMASPHVAGVAALIVGAGIKKPDAVEEILMGTARRPKGSATAGARVDDHYGAGIVDAAAALTKARDGRGAGELALACAASLFGVMFMRRRGIAIGKLGLGFGAALVAGSSGLFFLPGLVPGSWGGMHAAAGVVSTGFAGTASGLLGSGNPLVWSAIVPLALVALLNGVKRLRPLLAGFGFGVAGVLLFAAVSGTVDVTFIPGFLEPAWLGLNGLAAALLASTVVRKG